MELIWASRSRGREMERLFAGKKTQNRDQSVCVCVCVCVRVCVRVCVTCHGERLDAGLHLSSVLLLQPGTVQQSDGRLQQLSHDGVMSLWPTRQIKIWIYFINISTVPKSFIIMCHFLNSADRQTRHHRSASWSWPAETCCSQRTGSWRRRWWCQTPRWWCISPGWDQKVASPVCYKPAEEKEKYTFIFLMSFGLSPLLDAWGCSWCLCDTVAPPSHHHWLPVTSGVQNIRTCIWDDSCTVRWIRVVSFIFIYVSLLFLCASAVPSASCYPGHVHCEVFKQLPDVVGRVDFLHLHLRVHVTVIHEVHIGHFHLHTDRQTSGKTRWFRTLPTDNSDGLGVRTTFTFSRLTLKV